jgi:hypothetical protein
MSEPADIHVGDVGTVYQVPCYDNDLSRVNFDPTSAATKQLIFSMPGASTPLARTAIAVQVTINAVAVWCLAYTVVAADVVAGQFHQQPGPVKLQGYLQYSAAQSWKSSVVATDQQGRALQVVANIT